MRFSIVIFFICQLAFANSHEKLLADYVKLLTTKEEKLIANVFSQSYLKDIGGEPKIKKLYSKVNLFVPKKYDFKVKESQDKNTTYLQFSFEDAHNHKQSVWFRVKSQANGQLLIDGIEQDLQ